MNPPEEFQILLQQATEHLRYFRELGITHFGEQVSEPAAIIKSENKVSISDFKSNEVAPAPVIITPNESITDMATKKVTPDLFGEETSLLPLELQIKDDSLEKIRADLGDCQRCKLAATRTNIVFGEGNPKAELMFVGEAPGADEDASGRPFIGRAGQLLTKMIEAINFKREDIYIANIIKSRPPGNRNPERDEVAMCIPFLYRQIATIKPRLIVTLGNPSTQGLLNTKEGITTLRGHFHDYPRIEGIKIMPTFHPAYLLRSPDKKKETWEDLKMVRDFLK